MPTYDYHCEKCEMDFELFQSMKDAPVTVCPREKCRMETWGEGKVKRQLGTGAGLIFKGSGFYITDYRSEGYKAAAQKETSGSAPAGESKGGSTEAKAAPAKSESKPAGGEAKSTGGGSQPAPAADASKTKKKE